VFLWQALALHNGGQVEEARQVVRDFLHHARLAELRQGPWSATQLGA
jgi:hypothetical protein